MHRVPPADGDAAMAARLDALADRGARSVAAAVVDQHAEPRARYAFIDATADTRFEIGSITKGLTGMLLADAVERGEVALATTVDTIDPGYAGAQFGSLTMRELCTHTSGLPRLPRSSRVAVRAVSSALFGSDPYRGATEAALLDLAARQRLRNRGRSHYSNLGAAALGQLVAAAAGRDYAALLHERVLRPIGMRASAVAARDESAPRGRSPRGRRMQPWIMDAYAPAGAAFSTIDDMAGLANSLLDGTAPGHRSLLPLEVDTDRPSRATGMFWVIDPAAGPDRTMIWHNGQTGGYSAFFALLPDTRRAVVVLANVARAPATQRVALDLLHAARPS